MFSKSSTMKKIFVAVTFFCLGFFAFSQSNNFYVKIDYTSICCGTPSGDPIHSFYKKFQKENHLKKFEIYTESGLGKEGEFAMYIGIDGLNTIQKKTFLKKLKTIADNQNKTRNSNSDGYVSLNDKLVSKSELKEIKLKPRTRISSIKEYKY
jgi:hypothetical protein